MSLDDITLAVDYFDLKKIAESGQCFRWKELGPGKYLIPSGKTCAIMEQKEPDDDLHLLIEEGTLPLWQDYLNYGERYGSIVREAREATLADGSPDLFLREAVLEAIGVQILTQDLWETLVSFVISQNNNIPRIKKLVAALCKQFGDRRQLAGHEFYTFPTWDRLAGQDLSGLGLGYRDKYVEQLAQNVTDGRIDLHELTGMETEQARTYLKSIHGVGNKVADCVLLFGLHRVEVMTTYLPDFSRNILYRAEADVPGLRTGFRSREVALIELRSLFIPNEGTAYLLDLLSRMTDENSVSTKDNGVTQTVEARQGVALNALVEVKPRIQLQPFRTFLEVPQPESEFLLRVDPNEGIGFFEADGGVWKLEAKRNIADYFEKNLKDLIEAGKVVVMK